MKKWFPVVFLALICCTSGLLADDSCSRYEIRTIEVTGNAELEFPPNFVEVGVKILLKGDVPADLQAQVSSAAAKALEFINSLGIENKDVSTNRISLIEADWEYDDEDCPKPPERPEYEAEMSITIVLRDFSVYDKLLTGLFDHGVNRLTGIVFDSTERVEKRKEVRLLAVRAAKEKALTVSQELRQKLGHPLEITFVKPSYGGREFSNFMAVEEIVTKAPHQSSISISNIKVEEFVRIVFELEDISD